MYKSFKVIFMNGPLTVVIRYYSKLSIARRVASRYVKFPCGGATFSHPCAEIYGISYDRSVLLEAIY